MLISLIDLFLETTQRLKQEIVAIVPILILVAMISGSIFELQNLKRLIPILGFLIIYPLMVNLATSSLYNRESERTILITLILNVVFVPIAGYLIGTIFFEQRSDLFLGYLIISMLPTSGGLTVLWTGITNGNVSVATKLTVFGLILGSSITPFYLSLIKISLEVSFTSVLRQVSNIIFIPLILGQATRWYLMKTSTENEFKRCTRTLSSISFWSLILLIFSAVAIKAEMMLLHPYTILRVIIPLCILYLLNYLVSNLIGNLFLPREDKMALVYSTAMRSLSVALVFSLSISSEGSSDLAVLIAIAYIMQIQSATWYSKIV